MRAYGLAAAIMAIMTITAGSALSTGSISDNVVKIGLLLDMSGPYADITGAGR